MNPSHIVHLVCPACKGTLDLVPDEMMNGRVKKGSLICKECFKPYPVLDFIPRFVSEKSNYCSGFGFQWNRHYLTQYDRYSGAPISRNRFFEETRWPEKLEGSVMLEAGSGSGRFTEHAVTTGAMVISFDYSNAVDANYKNNGHNGNLLIVQASIYEMPFRPNYFDKVICIGVIQHTPDPEKSFLSLSGVLKSQGNLVIDLYKKLPWWKRMFLTKYWVRPVTKKLPPSLLYGFCESWVNLWWGFTGFVFKLSGRRTLSWFLFIADYRGVYPLSDKMLKEWSILDSFDMLSPAYDYPQTISSVSSWFEKARFSCVEVSFGYNGIEGRGVKG